jgi:hypothetical protein
MKYSVLVLLVANLFWFGCSPVLRDFSKSTEEYTLTNKVATSSYSGLKINLPVGWREIESEEFDIWLVDDDYTSAIVFTPINIENTLAENQNSEKESLIELLSYSKALERAKHQNSFNQVGNDEFETIGSLSVGIYKYKVSEGLERRTVVFPFQQGFYECKAVITNEEMQNNIHLLFKIQNSILKNL